MRKKIAVVASSIDLVKQGHLLLWFRHLNQKNDFFKFQLFLGSRKKNIPESRSFKINSRLGRLKYLILGKGSSHIQPLLDYKPDIVHLLTSNAFEYIQPMLNKNLKVIVSFRGYDINVFPHQCNMNLKITQEIFKNADSLHFVSNALMHSALHLGAPKDKCLVITRSLRVTEKKNQIAKHKSDNDILIASVGRLVWEKGYIYALEAMYILKSKGIRFKYLIGGSGIDENAIRYHIKRLNLEDYVELLGQLNREEVWKLLSDADIFLQTSLIEAMPNTIIEASFFSLPIVSSNIGGIPEVVENEINGFLSPVCQPKGFALSLEKLINDVDLRKTMGTRGREKIKIEFNPENEIEKWIALYKVLC